MTEIATLFHQLTLGVYVVGVANAGQRDGFTAAWVMQVSFDPLLLALSINPANACYSRWGCHHPAPLIQNRT